MASLLHHAVTAADLRGTFKFLSNYGMTQLSCAFDAIPAASRGGAKLVPTGLLARAPMLTEAVLRARYELPDARAWAIEAAEYVGVPGRCKLVQFIALFDSAGRILTMPELLP